MRLFENFTTLIPLHRKSLTRTREKYFVTTTTRIAWWTRWRGSRRAWSWPSWCPSGSWARAGTPCSTATTSTSARSTYIAIDNKLKHNLNLNVKARSTGASLSWSSSSSFSTFSLPWWATPMPRWTHAYNSLLVGKALLCPVQFVKSFPDCSDQERVDETVGKDFAHYRERNPPQVIIIIFLWLLHTMTIGKYYLSLRERTVAKTLLMFGVAHKVGYNTLILMVHTMCFWWQFFWLYLLHIQGEFFWLYLYIQGEAETARPLCWSGQCWRQGSCYEAIPLRREGEPLATAPD